MFSCTILFAFQTDHTADAPSARPRTQQHLHPALGVEAAERAYGGDCALLARSAARSGWRRGWALNWGPLRDTLFDEFVLAHALGWWGKALILRDASLLWTLSIAFELLERTFAHMLPNFSECWWDSWILDVSLCNWAGMALGLACVRRFGGLAYDWRGLSQQRGLARKAARAALQLAPHSLDRLAWAPFSSPARCLQCFFPVLIMLLFEANHFFLKFELWVPPTNPLNTYRLIITWLMAMTGIREYYDYIEAPPGSNAKLGAYAWLGIAIACAETAAAVKFGRGLFPAPWPRPVLAGWGAAAAVFAVTFSIWSYRFYMGGKSQTRGGAGASGGAAPRRTSRRAAAAKAE